MTIQTQFILDDDGNQIAAIIPIEDYNTLVKPIKDSECKLSDEEKAAINEAIKQSEQGLSISHEQAMQKAKERFPKYFK